MILVEERDIVSKCAKIADVFFNLVRSKSVDIWHYPSVPDTGYSDYFFPGYPQYFIVFQTITRHGNSRLLVAVGRRTNPAVQGLDQANLPHQSIER